MKTNFAYYCGQRNEELKEYIDSIPHHRWWRKTMSYDDLLFIMEKYAPPPSPHILSLLKEQREGFERPAPRPMDKERKEAIILKEIERFNKNPTTFDYEEFKLEIDGYTGYIRRDFVAKPGEEISEKDVEYHIHLNNYKECRLKREQKSWGAFIYINEPDYWCNGKYKSIPGTHYGVQHSKHF
jgi:hypothetical protein